MKLKWPGDGRSRRVTCGGLDVSVCSLRGDTWRWAAYSRDRTLVEPQRMEGTSGWPSAEAAQDAAERWLREQVEAFAAALGLVVAERPVLRVCGWCGGTELEEDEAGGMHQCDACDGEGRVADCPFCGGALSPGQVALAVQAQEAQT